MGRERKPQVGTTNLSTHSSLLPNTMSSSMSDVSLTQTFKRSATHKLIIPDEQKFSQSVVNKNYRQVDNIASWRVTTPYQIEFRSTHKDSYNEPSQRSTIHNELQTMEALAKDEAKQSERNHAIEKLVKIAHKHYGNTANMFKAFNKRSGDSLTFDEFSQNLRKRNLDADIPMEEQLLIYEAFDKKNEGSIQVDSVLKRVEENEILDTVAKRDMNELRAFLAEELKRRREATQHDEEAANKSNPKIPGDNKDELLKKAIGQKTYGLDIGTEELNEVIEEVFKRHHTNQSHSKFSRYLRMTNLKIHLIPFYDLRNEELVKLKSRASNLDDQIKQPEFVNRLRELKGERKNYLKTSQSLLKLRPGTLPHPSNLKQLDEVEGGMEPMTLGGTGSTSDEGMKRSFSTPAMCLSPLVSQQTLNRLEKTSAKISNANNASSSAMTTVDLGQPDTGDFANESFGVDDSLTPGRVRTSSLNNRSGGGGGLPPSSRQEVIMFDSSQSLLSDFAFPHDKPSKGIMNVSCGVINNTFGTPAVTSNGVGGNRYAQENATDAERMGLSMNDDGRAQNPMHRVQSVTSEYFADLNYNTATNISRDALGDADMCSVNRASRRTARRARMDANLQVTKDRLELEALQEDYRFKTNCQLKTEDLIRYQTAIFLNDMKCFKKQPLQTMLKKPNLNVSDVMWGGHQRAAKDCKDERDFSTTHRTSYDFARSAAASRGLVHAPDNYNGFDSTTTTTTTPTMTLATDAHGATA